MQIRKLPFLPLEKDIDALISACNRKTATFLLLLKETGARFGEAWQLEWIDFDFENKSVNITPEKGSNQRKLKISDRLIAMLNCLPKDKKMYSKAQKDTSQEDLEDRGKLPLLS